MIAWLQSYVYNPNLGMIIYILIIWPWLYGYEICYLVRGSRFPVRDRKLSKFARRSKIFEQEEVIMFASSGTEERQRLSGGKVRLSGRTETLVIIIIITVTAKRPQWNPAWRKHKWNYFAPRASEQAREREKYIFSFLDDFYTIRAYW